MGTNTNIPWNASGETKLLEELAQTFFIFRDLGVVFVVDPFHVDLRHDGRSTVPRTRNVDDLELTLRDEAVQMHIHEVL